MSRLQGEGISGQGRGLLRVRCQTSTWISGPCRSAALVYQPSVIVLGLELVLVLDATPRLCKCSRGWVSFVHQYLPAQAFFNQLQRSKIEYEDEFEFEDDGEGGCGGKGETMRVISLRKCLRASLQ